jgi:ornithine carbamoyltransferase
MRHVLSIMNLESLEISSIVDRTIQIADGQTEEKKPLEGKTIGIYFRKTSTRTRTSFTLGAIKLGASVIAYGPDDLQSNTGETIQDTTRVLSGYLDALVIRTAESIDEMRELARQDKMAIINAMSDKEHPTQALSDLATIKEHFGYLEDLNILYIGEGNSTATALALVISKMRGIRLTMFTPMGYSVPEGILQQSQAFALQHGAQIEEYHDLDSLPRGVDVVYTTRWQTTGSFKEDPNWKESFKPFGVTQTLMDYVSKPSRTIFMHDLPAVRGEDVSSEVLDGPQSIAFQQAQNKLFGAMAVLEWCLS